MKTSQMEEESRALLRRIVEAQAWRQLLLAHIRGHGVRLVPDLHEKCRLASELETSLRHFGDLQALNAELGGGDVVSVVRTRLERIDFPNTRLELSLCLFLGDRAARTSLSAYNDSKSDEMAAFARLRLEALTPTEAPADDTFAEFCADEGNRPRAQQLFDRWLSIVLLSLGRPGTTDDARAVALGLRSQHSSDSARDLLDGLRRFMDGCGLAMPDAGMLGVELPPGFATGT